MAGTKTRVQRGLVFAILGTLCATFLLPLAVSADTNLVVGGQAVIAYANGDQVRMREDIGYDAPVRQMFDEGTWVNVLDGPFTDAEGNYWYQVSIGDVSTAQPGFIVADFLALDTGVSLEVVAETGEQYPTEVSVPAIGEVIGIAYVAETNGDGVRCRTGADAASPVIAVLPEGSVAELTGGAIGNWQPVNCAGSGGYVSLDFISYTAPGAASTEVIDDVVGETVEVPTEAADPIYVGEVTGSGVISGTNGDGVRCRNQPSYDANILVVLSEGTNVDLAGAPVGEWQPVYCAGSGGYIHVSFVSSGEDLVAVETETDSDGNEPGDEAVAEEATVENANQSVGGPSGVGMVVGTNGAGLRCRTGATYSSSIITVVPEGSELTMNGSAQGEWQPVTCAGTGGYVHSMYFEASGGSGSTGANASNGESGAVSGDAMVDTGGGGLNCRSGAGMVHGVLTVLSNGSDLQLRGAPEGVWQPVVCNGINGYVHSDYIMAGSSDNSGSAGSGETSEEPSVGVVSGQGQVTGTGGGGLRLRSQPSYSGSIIAVIGEGKVVDIRDGGSGVWTAVTFNGMDGFVHMDYVGAYDESIAVPLSNTANEPEETTTSTTFSGLGSGDRAATTADLRLRYDPNYSSGIAAVAPYGTVVAITGSVTNGFYPVDWDGIGGYMHGDYLSWTDAPLSERGGSASPAPAAPTNTQSGTIVGNNLVDYAMQYVGYPYVWATHGPYSFDCSGFTYWVVKNVLGIDIGAGTWTQASAGYAVGRGELQPGDIVLFQNTYTWGLSHVGLYIGNDQFIHAENESTGVKISDLNSNYYGSRWYGARRLT